MKTHTITALSAIVSADPPRTQKDRDALLRVLGIDGGGKAPAPIRDRLLSFHEAAALLHRTPRTAHMLAKDGHLKKAMLPGRKRCAGVMQSSVEMLIANLAGEEVVG